MNKYACRLEDALEYQKGINDSLVQHYGVVHRQIESLRPALQHYLWVAERHDAMEKMLTDPNLLADWTLQMLGEGGIYGQPQQQPQSQQPQPTGMRQVGNGFNRPTFPSMPAPYGGGTNQNWQILEQVLEADPANAWRVFDRMTPNDFQARQLVAL